MKEELTLEIAGELADEMMEDPEIIDQVPQLLADESAIIELV